jgi:RNA polymerase sigma-70 factor (ECF subfamily)
LQQLPARQRAVLVLRDVLSWPAADVATLLDMSVAAVNSALQRAHAQIARAAPTEEATIMTDDIDAQLLEQFVTAFEAADVTALSDLLKRDVLLEMPPIPTWFTGRTTVSAFLGERMRTGNWTLVPTRANGCPAAATYLEDADGRMRAHSIQVFEAEDGEIAHIYAFLDPDLFACFGLPDEWASVIDGPVAGRPES